MSIHWQLRPIVEKINHFTGMNKKEIKSTIEDLMSSDNDFNGSWAETKNILVVSQEPDKYHYDIYLKIDSVFAINWLKHKQIFPDYKPEVDK